jgi:hypothetical protein
MALAQLEPVTYEVTVGTTGTPLIPPPITISDFEADAPGTIRFYTAAVPRWLRVGMTLTVNGETASKEINKSFRVTLIDPGFAYFEVQATWLTSLAGVWANPLNGATGTVTATAQFHAQRMTVRNPSGVVLTLQPTAGTAFGYQPTVAAGAEKEITAPNGAKFDAAEWHGRVAAATQVMQVYLL